MFIFDIPYSPAESETWLVLNGEDAKPFRSRGEALRYAMTEAARVPDVSAAISIEGADGQWRLFDRSMQPVKT
ncbi:DUF2188 domain-containing protein [Dyella jejuensis]|uniref:DUF2188 domain-containing protein n=1 Tax=Dyella jejuensis TaxID=1432009 RepID=A0ABW8JK43_9GAMM